jgi:hypothetical protein
MRLLTRVCIHTCACAFTYTNWSDCWPVNLTKKFRDEIATSCPGIELMYIPAGATVTI